MKINSFEFIILPGNPPPNFPYRADYNKAYQYFKKTWERLFNRPNRPKLYDPMGVFRQSYIFQISHQNQVISQTLATHYNLNNDITRELPFFEGFLGKPEEYLLSNNSTSLLSFEFSSVHRDYSARKLNGLNLYKVIIQLCINLAKDLAIDAVIGHPRRVTKTNDLIGETGCKCIVPFKDKYGVTVDIYIGLVKDLISYKDNEVMGLVENLWQKRTDSIGITLGSMNSYHSYFQRNNISNNQKKFRTIDFQGSI